MVAGRQDVLYKDDGSPATRLEADIESLQPRRVGKFEPCAVVVGEETGGVLSSSGIEIAIDPVDGTWAFLSGTETYTTTLAVFRDGAPVLGIEQESFHIRLLDRLAASGVDRSSRHATTLEIGMRGHVVNDEGVLDPVCPEPADNASIQVGVVPDACALFGQVPPDLELPRETPVHGSAFTRVFRDTIGGGRPFLLGIRDSNLHFRT